MKVFRLCSKVFVYFFVVFPIVEVLCVKSQVPAHFEYTTRVYEKRSPKDHIHVDPPAPPCEVCPRHGTCVPHIQCPARMRAGSFNPACHIGGSRGTVGVCCFTGSGHAAESDKRPRSASISPQDIKNAHNASRSKLTKWLKTARHLATSPHACVNDSSPSFAHHLSMQSHDPNIDKLSRGALLNLFTAQELKAREAITDEDIHLGFIEQTDSPYCPPQPSCPATSRFTTLNGACNNPGYPDWGAANTGYVRLLPPLFGDGVWSLRLSSSGQPLPSARIVSTTMLPTTSLPHSSYNLLFMQFGQFIVHDVSAGIMFTNEDKSPISCCINDGEDYQPSEAQHWACAAIEVPPEDPFFKPFGHRCMNFVRSHLAPASDCSVGYANPMNGATHHLDLSHLYGSSDEKVSALRAPGGLLKTFNDFGRQLPPLTDKPECLSAKKGAACFESGDNHGNQVISLTVFHTLWTREHNRVAAALSRLNPAWTHDRVYWETRRILQAEFQNVVYNEWLPLLLGPKLIQLFGLTPSLSYSSDYDPNMNPSISAEFSAAAMRFGHSMVDGKLLVADTSTNSVYETISLPEVMFQPARLRLRPFLDRLLAGLTLQPMQNVDPFVTESLTRYLFHGGNPYGLDLASINIQRGRDFGIRPYNDYRRLIGLEPLDDFNKFAPSAAHRLSSVYQSPEDVDLWVGGLLEEADEGSLVGATFAHIIADQFARLKRGDRYFYEHGPDVNPGAFTPGQLAEIKKVTLARIICDNKDGFELFNMPPNAFVTADLPGNAPVHCDGPIIPSMDLNRFKEM